MSTIFDAEEDPLAALLTKEPVSKLSGKGLSSYMAELRTRRFLRLPVTWRLVASFTSKASQIWLGSATGARWGSASGPGSRFVSGSTSGFALRDLECGRNGGMTSSGGSSPSMKGSGVSFNQASILGTLGVAIGIGGCLEKIFLDSPNT